MLKAVGRVIYCKLLRELIKRDIPSIYLRLLLNMYTSGMVQGSWNDVCSQLFNVTNGVKRRYCERGAVLCQLRWSFASCE